MREVEEVSGLVMKPRWAFLFRSLSHPHAHFEIPSCRNTPLTDDPGTTQAQHPPPSAKSVWEQVRMSSSGLSSVDTNSA